MRCPVSPRLPTLFAASILAIASGASADGLARLAPPGACAEPREAVAGSAVPGSEATEAEVLGALQRFFQPSDVAAPPEVAARPTPGGVATVRYPGACETGGSACQSAQVAAPPRPPIVGGERPNGRTQAELGAVPVGPSSPIVSGTRPGRKASSQGERAPRPAR